MAKKHILLLGAGHTNIQVLHLLAVIDRSIFDLTLVSDHEYSSYSGMIPTYMAGFYKQSQLQFNLKEICQKYNYRFIQGEVVEISAESNTVLLSNGPRLDYDICSINIGIKPQVIPTDAESRSGIIYLKPISNLIHQWNQIISHPTDSLRFAIIGGGAAAFEIAIACRRHFSNLNHKVVMITGSSKLLSSEIPLVQKYARDCLRKMGIDLIEGLRVEKINSDHFILSDGKEILRQIVLLATTASAPSIFKKSNLPISAAGFIQVDQHLNVCGIKNLFASGDCCEFTSYPLPKAGVFAVREAPIVFKNILTILNNETTLLSYIPQTQFLKILVSGNHQAIATYGKFAFKGWLAWLLKDYIDRRFMKRFQ